ncbi:MAG: orotate phosphoribosyltransferase-like protein [Candidatus Hydrothermarchaeota archaeon]|mgnify:CR=1 FL=1|nr:MAG: orotate phosphoribosyltransferase-like protein [Candidatus Hydrothermarchaeota archaeon]
MQNLDEIIRKAKELKEKGFTTGEIADELNVSRATALWLITQDMEKEAPKDIYVDWSSIGSNPKALKNISLAMAEIVKKEISDIEVVAGIAVSGLPLATIIAEELNVDLAVIRPRKHLWEPDKKPKSGFILSNFAKVAGKKVLIVDDIATTGTTIKEAIELLESMRAKPIGAIVVIDKKGLHQVKGIPVRSLIRVSIVE